jgi:prophage tail gpP-like protein
MSDDFFDFKTEFDGIFGPSPLTGAEPNDFTIVVEGVPFRAVSGRAKRAMDTVVDGWSALVRWDPQNTKQSEILRPFGYQKAECYVGEDLIVRGIVPTTASRGGLNGIFKSLKGYSLPYDMVDSEVKPPFEQTKVTLKERAETLLADYPISVVFDVPEDEPFDRVTANPSDKLFAHLLNLATQRGILMTSTPIGELLFTVANTSGQPVDSLVDNFPPGTEYEIEFDGRKRFYEYRVRAQTPGRRRRKKAIHKTASAFDEIVPVQRFRAREADEASMGNIQRAADWDRSKVVAEALTLPYPVSGWYTSKGTLWQENTIVTVNSDVLHVPDGYNFLIREVEYIFSAQGTSAILGLVPPQVYTGEPIDEPWV